MADTTADDMEPAAVYPVSDEQRMGVGDPDATEPDTMDPSDEQEAIRSGTPDDLSTPDPQ